jgi:formylglycine-generating enzyme required for sulfatase activity
MKRKFPVLPAVLLFCLFMSVSYSSFANNISITNTSLTGRNTANHYVMVKFDISWENSWRTSSAPNNWDAAWVFVKYRVGTGAWMHTYLNNTGHINPAGSLITTGLIVPKLPFHETNNPGLGIFIYRDADGTGTFSKTGVQLRWNYGANGVADTAIIDIRVYAIEQVYVPQGSFYAGSGGTEFGAFYKYPITTNPYLISGEGAIPVGTVTDNIYYPPYGLGYSGDQLGPIPAAFPKGYDAFYCMKYEISQQGYVDFLNSLTEYQIYARLPDYNGSFRFAITCNFSTLVSSTTNPFLACNFLGWYDLTAYLDWSGLRPMTELEFEKCCRGTLPAVPNEYAWGTTGFANYPYTLIYSGLTNENIASNYSTTLGNAEIANTSGNINGPVRAGIFASNGLNTGRVSSGATYYGIMEMSGNLYERPITVGTLQGRAFSGANGNGLLDAEGNADVWSWAVTSNFVSGFRGGSFAGDANDYFVSGRGIAAMSSDGRMGTCGGRGVRSAP